MTISEDRIERAARAIAAYDNRCRDAGICIPARVTTRGNPCCCFYEARAALVADAHELAAAEARGRVEGLREAAAIYQRGEVGDNWDYFRAFDSAISARISALSKAPTADTEIGE